MKTTTHLPAAVGRLVSVRIEVPTDDGCITVVDYKTRHVEASIETDEPDFNDWIDSGWITRFLTEPPDHILKFKPEGTYTLATLTPDKQADDTWPYEHTETDEPERPSHRKPYNDRLDRHRLSTNGRHPGRHAKKENI